MKIGSRGLGELLFFGPSWRLIGTCKGLIGTYWNIMGPIKIPKPYTNPLFSPRFAKRLHGSLMGLPWAVDDNCYWPQPLWIWKSSDQKNAGVGPADDRLTPSKVTSGIRVARCPIGVDIAGREAGVAPTSWRHGVAPVTCCAADTWKGCGYDPKEAKMFLYIWSWDMLGQSHNNSTTKIARNTLAVAWAWLFVRVWKKMEESRSA